MATWPAKTNYATGDVLTAAEMQDIGNALNSVGSAQYAAGKNKIINGDFRLNQRAFTSVTTNGTYGFDRWNCILTAGGGTVTYTPETFTVGAAPVAGYEAINFLRIVTASQTGIDSRAAVEQRIEDVRTFAGQTITVSFWAKAGSGTPNIIANATQVFGSGGSGDVVTAPTKQAISTSWARYSFNISVPSISGKTIGTNSYLRIRIWVSAGSNNASDTDSLGIQNGTFDIWGVQAEAGNTATAFQTATGTLAGELAAARRYYQRFDSAGANQNTPGFGSAYSTTAAAILLKFDSPMRVIPTSVEFANVRLYDFVNFYTITGLSLWEPNTGVGGLLATGATGLTQYRPYTLFGNGTGYVAFSAEL